MEQAYQFPTPEELQALKPVAAVQPVSTQVEKLTLPEFITRTVTYNLRLKIGRETINQAQADFVTDSLIPNCQFMSQGQLIPLSLADINHQQGPPQYDNMLTIPIDWLLFGKRVAAMEASRWQVDVKEADQADLVRRTVTQAVLLFYDYLQANELIKVVKEDIEELQKLETIALKNFKAGMAKIDSERVRLSILDSIRELHRRESALASIKSRLRAFIGRNSLDPDFELVGTLEVSKALPPLDVRAALELARSRRPDLRSDDLAVAQSRAAIEKEERKKYPQMAVQAGFSYQDQVHITGYPNATLLNVNVTTSLPFTDRNQGNILKAYSALRASQDKLEADTADALAEVEAAAAAYKEAFEAVTTDDPATLTQALDVLTHTREAYEKGGDKNILDMLDAVRTYRDRVRSLVSTKTSYWQALHALNGAMGVFAMDPDQGRNTPK